LRYLRRVRELGFRDLGGLVFELQRFGRSRDDLVQAKLDALTTVDGEMRALERVLDDHRPIIELREPGISSCLRCGAVHGSDARFCPSCGLQLAGPRPLGEIGAVPGAAPVVSPTPPPPGVRPNSADAAPAGQTGPAGAPGAGS
jgi:ribosomal protein L40E